ncbi:MAG: RNA pseudouridine synthase [Simkaniaceae bacterium]|nr:RNA pseudouridine synthase [Simkaniaceae bacterium]
MHYIDNHLLIGIKPPGMQTQPDFEEMMKQVVKKKFDKPGKVFLHAVHRLDTPVGGLVLFARTTKALSRLNAMMRQHEITKGYKALIEGKMPAISGELIHYLVHGDRRAEISVKDDPQAKEAILSYIQKGKEVLITLKTGRYHQIRAQLAAVGCPIIGDSKYGSRVPYAAGIALRATKLAFIHPVTKAPLVFEV